ncbi:MAG: hypothetical protein JNK76_04740 [Planctomycetales bacterium]|nr:hypothetical protein [Planctomycetales bacterium]MBN8624146.1 hypothetical protein [Planctomycetota bacterium]
MPFRFALVVGVAILSGFGFGVALANAAEADVIDIGARRELFLDLRLIDSFTGVRHVLQLPRDEGPVLARDEAWEDERPSFVFGTILRDGDRYRMYYRGHHGGAEITCLAESPDGRTWTKPKLGLIERGGTRDNNIVLDDQLLTHNFAPFIDENPAAPPEERYKAIAGAPRNSKADPKTTGPRALVSADGLHWRLKQEMPVLSMATVLASLEGLREAMLFDSQNVVFWSTMERRYVMYFRVYKDGLRRVARAESDDFVNWTNLELVEYGDGAAGPGLVQDLYITQLSPYYRAPHQYVGIGARLLSKAERRIVTDEQAAAMQLDMRQAHGLSDAVLMSSRGGPTIDRPFMEGFLRPSERLEDWVARSNYPMRNIVPTGPLEMSFYVQHHNGQPSAHVRRHSLRIDGFTSLQAPYSGGEIRTKPLKFAGRRLLLNFATSAAGDISVELQDAAGRPIPGFALADAVKTVGNELQRAVRWKSGDDVSPLAGRSVRLRIVMRDADLYAFRFGE